MAEFEIEETSIECYPSLEAAQDATLPMFGEVLGRIIRSGLDNGKLIVQDGLVQLREGVDDE